MCSIVKLFLLIFFFLNYYPGEGRVTQKELKKVLFKLKQLKREILLHEFDEVNSYEPIKNEWNFLNCNYYVHNWPGLTLDTPRYKIPCPEINDQCVTVIGSNYNETSIWKGCESTSRNLFKYESEECSENHCVSVNDVNENRSGVACCCSTRLCNSDDLMKHGNVVNFTKFHINVKAISVCFLLDISSNLITRISQAVTAKCIGDDNGTNFKHIINSFLAAGTLCLSLNCVKLIIERFWSLKQCKKYEKSNFSWYIYIINILEYCILVLLRYNISKTEFFLIFHIGALFISLLTYPFLLRQQKRLYLKIKNDFKDRAVFSLSQKYQILETEKIAKVMLPFIIIVALGSLLVGTIYTIGHRMDFDHETTADLMFFSILFGYIRDTLSVSFLFFLTIPKTTLKRLQLRIFKIKVTSVIDPIENSYAGPNGKLYFEQLQKQWI
uniref:Uncharacterized protein n=1 Tax=Parastrongyloides trichosuri TaxID=131310 RepID=A0A0N4ZJP8_PARTI